MAAYSEQEIIASNQITDEQDPRYNGWLNENNPWGILMLYLEEGIYEIDDEIRSLINDVIKDQPGINYVHPTEGNLLIKAMIMSAYDFAEELLKVGADPNIYHYDADPMYWAIINMHPEAVEMLIKYGADVNQPVFAQDTFDSYAPLVDNTHRRRPKYQVRLSPPKKASGQEVITPLWLALHAEWARLQFGYYIDYIGQARKAKEEMVCLLAENGADTDYLPRDVVEAIVQHCDLAAVIGRIEIQDGLPVINPEGKNLILYKRMTSALAA